MLDLLFRRRSIRKYLDKPVDQEKINDLIYAALLAPSAKAVYSQRFIVVEDKETLEKLSQSREHGSSFLKGSPLGIVVLGDSSLIDVWVEDTVIAATMIQITAKSLGLDSCWIQIRNRMNSESVTSGEYIQKLLQVPAHLKVECIISIGYASENKAPRKKEELILDRVYKDTYTTSQTL